MSSGTAARWPKLNRGGRNSIEIERLNSFFHVAPQLFPAIGLRKYAFTEGFGGKTTVSFLRNFKDDFVHVEFTSALIL